MDLMVEAETPMGFAERIEWSQAVHFKTSEPVASFLTEITSLRATVMIPGDVTAGMLSEWGANMPASLLSGFTVLASAQPGGWARKVFGWATAGLMGAAAGTSAVALKSALVLIIAAVATPAWGIVVAVIIGRPVFETFLAGLLGSAGAAAGYDINLAIWDKIAEMFEENPPAN